MIFGNGFFAVIHSRDEPEGGSIQVKPEKTYGLKPNWQSTDGDRRLEPRGVHCTAFDG
jgi:hypothetical protein